MNHELKYTIKTEWTSKEVDGNKNIRTYSRCFIVSNEGKPDLPLTIDNVAFGDNKL